MSHEHIKVHVLNNPKIKAELHKTKTMTEELWEQTRLDTGIEKDVYVSFLGDDDGAIYVIEGHKSQDDLFNLLKRKELPEGLKERLLRSYYDRDSRDTYQWKMGKIDD